MAEEPLIYREEVRAILGRWLTSSSRFEQYVRRWKETMAKKKETRREKIERVRREAENSPIVRKLRELAAGRAEDDYRRRAEEAG